MDFRQSWGGGACNLLTLSGGKVTVKATHEDVKRKIGLFQELLTKIEILNCNVGIVLCGRGERQDIVPIILSIIKSGHVFCSLPYNPDDKLILEYCTHAGLHYILSDTSLDCSSLDLIEKRETFYLFKWNETQFPANPCPILYIIRTSGSTGPEPKIVRVPEQCIVSNVLALKEKLRITSEDVILNCSPPTFDPFLVDVFLACDTGCALIIVEDFARQFHSLTKELFCKSSNCGVTLMQITPSIFRGLSRSQMEFMLSADSSLRVICFGGEPFPEDMLNDLQVDETKEIYNIYGITEISCWTSLRQWKRGEAMDLGDPLGDEIFEIRGELDQVSSTEGELWIGSEKRKCFIEELSEKKGIIFRPTGDLVERRGGRIYYKGRSGDVIKRFGVKINLLDIEKEVKRGGLGKVKDVCCVFEEKEKKILVFYSGMEEVGQELISEIRSQFSVLPDDVIMVQEMPISSHGKISKRKLLEIYFERRKSQKTLQKLLQGFDLKKSFVDNGGTSVLALQLLNNLESPGEFSYPNLIQMLLNPEIPLERILETVEILPRNSSPAEIVGQKLNIFWKYDLKKCIDADPVVFNHSMMGNCVAVGSHSNKFVVLSVSTGEKIAQFELPDRIESKMLIIGDNLYLGCYDGFFYCFNLIRKELNWSFNSHGMIKSEAIFSNNFIIFGNYSEGDNLFALLESGDLSWSRRVGNKGILSRAVIINEEFIGISTLDGTISILRTENGEEIRSFKLRNPVFTNPIVIADHLIVSEVTGLIHCLTQDLTILWSFKAEGNIFSSFAVEEINSKEFNLFFGCYDSCLYKLHVTSTETSLDHTLAWKSRKLPSSIYSAPFLYENQIICCTTKGSVIILHKNSGKIISQTDIQGEIFSSPVVSENKLIFGCRDNFLYCLHNHPSDLR